MREDIPAGSGKVLAWRHSGLVRVTHWVNALAVLLLGQFPARLRAAMIVLLASHFGDPSAPGVWEGILEVARG